MIQKLKTKEFKEKYLFNKHRKELFKILLDELDTISERCKCFKFLLFGSFITLCGSPGLGSYKFIILFCIVYILARQRVTNIL